MNLTPRQLDLLEHWHKTKSFNQEGFNGRIGGNLLEKLHEKRLITRRNVYRVKNGSTYSKRETKWTPAGRKFLREIMRGLSEKR